jgi:enamine deaminase RidA (YjgF/YER057c/UK114 family)
MGDWPFMMSSTLSNHLIPARLVLMTHLLPIAILMAYFPADPATGFALARTVPPGTPLIHTGQVFPGNTGDVRTQTADVAEQVKRLVGGPDAIVRLHVVVGPEVPKKMLLDALRDAFPDEPGRPALTLVRGTIEKKGALLAMDAVATGDEAKTGLSRVLPAGGRIDIAGQAEKADGTLAAATTATLESLEKTLKFLGSDRSKIVQLKAFYKPAGDAAVVRKAVADYFGADAPPLVLVEWTMDLPIEIELVAAPGPNTPDGLRYLTPPGMTASPVYSRTAVTQGKFDTVYVSGLVAPDGTPGPNQASAIYDVLKSILAATKTDMNHLTKATYYVTKADANKSLDVLRPTLYDPKRPPTASKSGAIGLVHDGGQGLLVDMIAVKIQKP